MKNRILISILLGVLLIGGWYTRVSDMLKVDREYKLYVAYGDDRFEKKLYQQAYAAYERALDIKTTKKVEDKLISSYEGYYQEEQSYSVRNLLIKALDKACDVFPSEEEYWKREIELYVENNNYEQALSLCNEAYSIGIDDDEFIELFRDVKYAYDEQPSYLADYKNCVNDYISVVSGNEWEILDETGEEAIKTSFLDVGYVSNEGIFLCKDLNGNTYFRDLSGVKCGIVEFEISEMGMYSQGYCTVKIGEEYALINLDGEILEKDLKECGSFQNGYVPIKKENDKWYMLDLEGKEEEKEFDSIVYDDAGKYEFSDTVIVLIDGKYQFYNSDLTENINEFKCEDIDVLTDDGLVAYQGDNGLWGYVDLEGNIVIEPQYQQAKSFSNGLAAVCMNNKWGYINKNNYLVIDYQYLSCGYCSGGGICIVELEEDCYGKISFMFPELIK